MGWPDPKFWTKICEILIRGIFAGNRMSVADDYRKIGPVVHDIGTLLILLHLYLGPKPEQRGEKSLGIFCEIKTSPTFLSHVFVG